MSSMSDGNQGDGNRERSGPDLNDVDTDFQSMLGLHFHPEPISTGISPVSEPPSFLNGVDVRPNSRLNSNLTAQNPTDLQATLPQDGVADMIRRNLENHVPAYKDNFAGCMKTYRNATWSLTVEEMTLYASQLIYLHGIFLRCSKCKATHPVGNSFEHTNGCIVKRCLQEILGGNPENQAGVETNGTRCSNDQTNVRPEDFSSNVSATVAKFLERPQMMEERRPVDGASGGPALTGASSLNWPGAVPRPQSSQYNQEEFRIRTFQNWNYHHVQNPKNLADAGLIYTGNGDACKCYECGIELRRWEFTDIPWREHAKWSSRCAFLLKRKGQDFVDEVQRNKVDEQFQTAATSFQNVSISDRNQPGSSGLGTNIDACKAELSSMGFQTDDIKEAMGEFKRDYGKKEYDLGCLVEIILKQADERRKKMDPLVCKGGCDSGIVSRVQAKCGHAVCDECVAKKYKGPCKVCGREVVEVNAFDPRS